MATERDFERYSALALRAANDAQVASTISKFMVHYAGDPFAVDGLPEVRRVQADGNEYEYDASLEKGYTNEGNLVHVRRSMGSSALGLPQTHTHFVVTASIDTGEFTEWRINDVRHMRRSTGLTSEFVLTTDKFDVHEGEPAFSVHENPLLAELARREFIRQQEERDAAQARLIMSNVGVWFKPANGIAEMVYDIRGVVQDHELIKAQMAEHSLAEVGANQPDVPIRSVS